jgi:hypothetical protein
MDDQPNQDKENVPPSFGSQKLASKQRKHNRSNPINTKGKWNTQALEEAMDAIEKITTSLRKASRHWNIPLTSVFDHLYGKKNPKK